ncbi:MAG: sporulation protein [Oscillospiraceae bacterium]|nr:sporulation protein [Oscillospiraceae bacterium]
MRDKRGVLERFSRVLDLPADIVADLPRISIIGGGEILIENHRGILLYNDTDIHVGGGKVVIKLHGHRMCVGAMNSNELSIKGKLLGIDFVYI